MSVFAAQPQAPSHSPDFGVPGSRKNSLNLQGGANSGVGGLLCSMNLMYILVLARHQWYRCVQKQRSP